ncbi:MAG: SLC13 family permease [bacterium]
MSIPLIALGTVFILIIVRQIGNIKLEIWQIMLLGALVVLLTKSIPVHTALKAIDINVLLFLFGMFVIGVAMEESGYISHISYALFKNATTMNSLVLRILFFMGFASAFLMNDTIAIIGTPVMLFLARKHHIEPKILLLTLAFAVTTGSVMSPIGNPQNLLIAMHGNLSDPFITFLKYLFIPTTINLLAAYWILKVLYRDQFKHNRLQHVYEPIKDKNLANLSKYALIIVILMIVLKTITSFLHILPDFSLTYIALFGTLPILIFSEKRIKIVSSIDWYTLVFFASMFVLMKSVWLTGFFQGYIDKNSHNITDIHSVMIISIILSQFISNVPMVALYLPILKHAGASLKTMVALASGSTIAGNLFILGAASNIIIIQNAEKRSRETITFFEFARAGIPLTIINTIVYWFFLNIR